MAGEIDYTFGCATVAGKTGWLVQSFSENNTAQEAMALDAVGEPVKIHFYQKQNEISMDVIIPTDESSIPAIGDVFTYDSVKYYVSSVSKTRNNTDFIHYNISAKRFTTANLPQ